MIHSKRRAISLIIGRLIQNKDFTSIYDFSTSSHYHYSGTVSKNINIYDFSRNSHLTGTDKSIYDFGTNSYIKLDVQENKFSGYDFETNYHFNGTMNGKSITFYDFQDNIFYKFTV